MAKAQLRINIDADNTKAVEKFKETKKEGIDAVQEIQQKNREALKGLLGKVSLVAIAVQALTMIVQKIGESIKRYFAQGDAFREMAKNANISAESVAYLKAQADAAGVSVEEFERSMRDLADGNTTLDMLSEKWGKLGDSIKSAEAAQKNFEQLTRQLNFDEFDKKATSLSGKIANVYLELLGSHGKQKAIMQRAVYEGKSLAEAASEAFSNIKWYEGGATFEELRQWYYETQSIANNDRNATLFRTMNKTAKKLAESEMSAEDRERIFKETTGQTFSNEAIIALAEQIKTAEEKLAESIKEATETEKKRLEEERKKEAEDERLSERLRQNQEDIEKEIEDTVKKIAKANITDEERSRLLRERYDMDLSGQEIREWAKELTTAQEALEEGLKNAETAKSKADKEAEDKQKAEDDFISKVAKADLSAVDREKAVKQVLGRDLSNTEILAIAETLKSFSDKASDVLEEVEKQKKIDDEIAKIKGAIEDTFTAGGGLIGGATYALRNKTGLEAMTAVAEKQLKIQRKQERTLEDVRAILKGE